MPPPPPVPVRVRREYIWRLLRKGGEGGGHATDRHQGRWWRRPSLCATKGVSTFGFLGGRRLLLRFGLFRGPTPQASGSFCTAVATSKASQFEKLVVSDLLAAGGVWLPVGGRPSCSSHPACQHFLLNALYFSEINVVKKCVACLTFFAAGRRRRRATTQRPVCRGNTVGRPPSAFASFVCRFCESCLFCFQAIIALATLEQY